jgi:Mn2+/Fe2+ NRAMP family transporter
MSHLVYYRYFSLHVTQNTAPPIIKTLSSSRLTHWMILFALCANAALLVVTGATAYNSNSGVLHASAMQFVLVS